MAHLKAFACMVFHEVVNRLAVGISVPGILIGRDITVKIIYIISCTTWSDQPCRAISCRTISRSGRIGYGYCIAVYIAGNGRTSLGEGFRIIRVVGSMSAGIDDDALRIL